MGSSLAVQCLGFQAFTTGGTGLITGWGTKIPQASPKKKKKKSLMEFKMYMELKIHKNGTKIKRDPNEVKCSIEENKSTD